MQMLVVIPKNMDKRDIPKSLVNDGMFYFRPYHRHEYELAKADAQQCGGKVIEMRIELLDMDEV